MRAITRQTNTQKRNERLRRAYAERYTHKPRPRIYTSEYVIAQLAEEYCLSLKTVEGIIWIKPK